MSQQTTAPSKFRTFAVWILLLSLILVLLHLLRDPELPHQGHEQFLADIAEGQIQSVRIDGNVLTVQRWDGADYQTLGAVDEIRTQKLSDAGALLHYGEAPNPMRKLLLVGLPLVLFIGLFLYFLRKASGGGMGMNVMELRKSRAKLLSEKSSVSFGDVGGCEEAKLQLGDIVDYLKSPERWEAAGVRMPRGVLLEGPPGCGKTLLAKAVAGETNASFFYVSASEFVEMFVGVGAARVRDMFEEAVKQQPAVVFIDELDAVGRKRGSGLGMVNDEREHTLNQLLVSLDGFDRSTQVVVIAATNRVDVLDAALLRPGRFDRRIPIAPLDQSDRERVLEIHTRGKQLDPELDLASIALSTEGASGAALESLANEAGLLALRRGRRGDLRGDGEGDGPGDGPGDAERMQVTAEDFERALNPEVHAGRRFGTLDTILIESTTQLAQPDGRARVRLSLHEGPVVEGDLLWADAAFLKIEVADGSGARIVHKAQIKTLEPLDL